MTGLGAVEKNVQRQKQGQLQLRLQTATAKYRGLSTTAAKAPPPVEMTCNSCTVFRRKGNDKSSGKNRSWMG
jgi:hypothetical protein